MSKQKIFLYTSEIAAYIGQNKYDYVTPFERLWKRCDPTGYNKVLQTKRTERTSYVSDINVINTEIQKLQMDLDLGAITKRQFTTRMKGLNSKRETLQSELDLVDLHIDSIDLSQEQRLVKKLGQETIDMLRSDAVETDTKRMEIERKLTTLNLTTEERKTVQTESTSYINKTHGTLKEDSAIKMFEKKYGITLDISQEFYKRRLGDRDDLEDREIESSIDWYIGGKMDGVYRDPENPEKSYIVEVKNRTKGFFTTLRDYEKTQIHLYMYMTGINVTKLVEKYKDTIRITVVYNDTDYTNSIIEYLTVFIRKFEQFLHDDSLKYKFISGSPEQRKQILNRLYINPINELVYNKILKLTDDPESESNGNCLIDDLD